RAVVVEPLEFHVSLEPGGYGGCVNTYAKLVDRARSLKVCAHPGGVADRGPWAAGIAVVRRQDPGRPDDSNIAVVRVQSVASAYRAARFAVHRCPVEHLPPRLSVVARAEQERPACGAVAEVYPPLREVVCGHPYPQREH